MFLYAANVAISKGVIIFPEVIVGLVFIVISATTSTANDESSPMSCEYVLLLSVLSSNEYYL